MGRRAKIKPDQENLIRIAATINLEQEPDFEFLRNFKGHGAIVREMLRLSLRGKHYELELAQIARVRHEAVISGLARPAHTLAREDAAQNQQAECEVRSSIIDSPIERTNQEPEETEHKAQVINRDIQTDRAHQKTSHGISRADGATKNFLA